MSISDRFTDQVLSQCNCSRRDFLRKGLLGAGVGALLPSLLESASSALAADELAGNDARHPNRILVVIELTGGNDGLNTVVPFANDAYYKARPRIGIPQKEVRKVNDEVGFHPALTAFERLYKEGQVAVVQGCGYPNPNLSHFTSMEYWHSGCPNGADSLGWAGRLADSKWTKPVENLLVNVGPTQKRAVQSAVHPAIVFNDPDKFSRLGTEREEQALAKVTGRRPSDNPTLDFLRNISETANASSEMVKEACAEYNSGVNYGVGSLRNDLRRVAALIAGKFATRIYYVNAGGWDTHSNQTNAQLLHLGYLDDALSGFMSDVKRLGRSDDVSVMIFSEFGRRVEENFSAGTDHGTAGPMFIVGKHVKGGIYEKHPSLTDLDDGNLKMTTDFRRVYATMIKEWMGCDASDKILKGNFPSLGVFA